MRRLPGSKEAHAPPGIAVSFAAHFPIVLTSSCRADNGYAAPYDFGGDPGIPSADAAGNGAAGADDDFPLDPSLQSQSSAPLPDASGSGGAAAGGAAAVQPPRAEAVGLAKESGGALYVAGLAWWTTDADVEAACSRFGRIRSLRFMEERSNCKSKGVALVGCGRSMFVHVVNGEPAGCLRVDCHCLCCCFSVHMRVTRRGLEEAANRWRRRLS